MSESYSESHLANSPFHRSLKRSWQGNITSLIYFIENATWVIHIALVPCYFFHMFNGHESPDLVGRDLASDSDAREAAIVECREMMTEAIRTGRLDLSHRIEVEDIYRRPLYTVHFADAVEIKS